MKAAQNEFVAQLNIGPAEYIGLCILYFGNAITEQLAFTMQLSPSFGTARS